MNIYKKLETEIKAIAQGLYPEANVEKIDAVPPKEDGHGDIATNAAMVLAAQTKQNPREIAAKIAEKIGALASVTKTEIAGPGFINLTLKPEVWQGIIPVVLTEGRGFGNSEVGKGVKVNVEYVSANPTGPMHIGHARYVYGDAIALLLMKAGYNVTREYYINDAGAQVEKLADSAYLRYREALGEDIGEIPAGLYPGDYLVSVGEGLAHQYGRKLLDQPRDQWFTIVRDFTIDAVMAMIKEDLLSLGIQHDVFVSERAITEAGKVDEAIRVLTEKGLIYTGVLEAPKGKVIEDWEAKEQTLFRSTQFGDDSDRPVKKSDGAWTYFAPDIAYHLDKIQRGHTRLINVFGVDHGGYVKRLQAAVNALSGGKATLEVKLCALVKFMRNGEPLKMSKRAGTFVTVREVLDEVGKDVLRFIMLTRKNDMPLDFDFEKVKEQTKDNPVFYVQYAHARCKSVIRHAGAEMPAATARAEKPDAALLAKLQSPEELHVMKMMASWPRVVEAAAIAGEPHRIAFYLHDLAAAFHSLWNQGNVQNELRFLIKGDIELTAARVALAHALATTIASGLMVLGVEPVEEMR